MTSVSSSFIPGSLPFEPPVHVSSRETSEQRAESFYFASSANTASLARYAQDLRRFRRWQDASVQDARRPASDGAIGVNDVLDYLEFEASRLGPDGSWLVAAKTARRWVNSIDRYQAARGWSQPGRSEAVRQILKGLDAERGRHLPVVMPVMLKDLRSLYSACLSTDRPVRIQDRRDSTMIMVTWIAALRATDVVGLTFDDIGSFEEGLTLRVKSFGDDSTMPGALRLLPRGLDIRSCPVCALYRWHDLLAATQESKDEESSPVREDLPTRHICQRTQTWLLGAETPLFPALRRNQLTTRPLSANALGAIMRTRVASAELTSAGISFSSLRVGFIAEAVKSGATNPEVTAQTGLMDSDLYERFFRQFDRSATSLDY